MAATIIDRLIMTLGFNVEDYKKGRKDVDEGQKKLREDSEKTRKVWEEDGKKAVNTFRAIRNEVLGLVGISLTAAWAKNFTESIVDSDAAVGRLAKNLGMATEDLSSWEGIFTQMGSAADDADNMFRTIQKTVMTVRAGQETPALGPLARILEGNLGEFMFGNTSNQRRAFLLSEGLTKMGREQAQLWGQQAGYTEQQINALLKGVPVLAKELDENRKIYAVTAKQAAEAERMQKLIDRMGRGWKDLGRTLMYDLAPTVIDLMSEFQHWLKNPETIKELDRAFKEIATTLKKIPWHDIGEDIKTIWHAVDGAAQAMGGWKPVLEGLAALWAVNKVAGMVSGIVMLGAALATPVVAGTIGAALLAIAAFHNAPDLVPDDWQKKLTSEDMGKKKWHTAIWKMPAGEGLDAIWDLLRGSAQSYRAESDVRKAAEAGTQVTINGNVIVQGNDAQGVVRGLQDLSRPVGTSTQSVSGAR